MFFLIRTQKTHYFKLHIIFEYLFKISITVALKPQQAIPINLPVSYFPEGSTTVFVEIWLHTDLDILSKECKLHKSKPKGHIHQYVREN